MGRIEVQGRLDGGRGRARPAVGLSPGGREPDGLVRLRARPRRRESCLVDGFFVVTADTADLVRGVWRCRDIVGPHAPRGPRGAPRARPEDGRPLRRPRARPRRLPVEPGGPPAGGATAARDPRPGHRVVDHGGDPAAGDRARRVGAGDRGRRGARAAGAGALRGPRDLPVPRLVPARRGGEPLRPRRADRVVAPGPADLRADGARPHGRVRNGVGGDLDRDLEHRRRRPHDADRARRPGREGRGPAPALRLGCPPDDRLRGLDRRDGDAHRHATQPSRGRLPRAARRRARHVHGLARLRLAHRVHPARRLPGADPAHPRPGTGRGVARRGHAAARGRERGRGAGEARGRPVDHPRFLARLRALARALAGPGRPRPRAPRRRRPRKALPRGGGGSSVRDPAVPGPGELEEAPVRPELGRRPARQLGRADALRGRSLARNPRRGDRHREVGRRGCRELGARHEPRELHAAA